MPTTFRSHLNSMGYNGFISYPSFNRFAETSQDKLKNFQIYHSLNPEEKRDFFATSILSESENLQFDAEGSLSCREIAQSCKIKNNVLFVGLIKTFQIWA